MGTIRSFKGLQQLLNDLMDRALKANPTIAAAQATLRVAQENMLAQGGTLLPSVGFEGSASKNETPTASLAPVAANNKRIYSLYSAGLNVSYSLDVFGLNRRTIESAAAQADFQHFERCSVTRLSRPATAPAGSNRSSYGGNEMAEAFGDACHKLVTARVCRP